MLHFRYPVNVIRYLIGWRVNSSIAWLPRHPAIETAYVLGKIIAKRFSSQDAGAWLKALQPLEKYFAAQEPRPKKTPRTPVVSWPMETVLSMQPGKRAFGRDEVIYWRMTILGAEADHGFFLEVILPAMEEAGFTSDPAWAKRNRLWGHFDIDSVHIARGDQWEPIVQGGKLDLRYAASPTQWLEGLALPERAKKHRYRSLVWTMPFDFSDLPTGRDESLPAEAAAAKAMRSSPPLDMVLRALLIRLNKIMHGKRSSVKIDLEEIFHEEEMQKYLRALEQAESARHIENNLKPPYRGMPGKRIGSQTYVAIPKAVLPYLDLASILHVGKQTLYGCGTFYLF